MVCNLVYFQMLYCENTVQFDTMEIHYYVWEWDEQQNIMFSEASHFSLERAFLVGKHRK